MNSSKVMLVDDQLSNLLALEAHLENMGFSVEKHTSPDTALESLLKEKADCILVDFDMPKINGIEFLKLVKEDPELESIPIMLMTGKVFSSNQAAKAIQLGAYDYLTKPINIGTLRSKVQLLVDYSLYRKKYYALLQQVEDKESAKHTTT